MLAVVNNILNDSYRAWVPLLLDCNGLAPSGAEQRVFTPLASDPFLESFFNMELGVYS